MPAFDISMSSVGSFWDIFLARSAIESLDERLQANLKDMSDCIRDLRNCTYPSAVPSDSRPKSFSSWMVSAIGSVGSAAM